ncbi:Ig-like domain-containing protein [Chryseolinea sp. H1M3-3]|uniref:Ig-like domain-containing protein n=1 Tax=Chryseolinea sp. H1M3-3 TaxID=3034144 RepID=UPI0023EB9E09|nr:Ig-like domain-containing protein [Chryseolinea sp. H1M3-3]
MNILKNTHWLLFCIFLTACARQTTPTGGPKDSIPPTLVNSNPVHEQLNFSGKTIDMTFSEAVILNNPKEQLIITPDLGEDVDVKTKKNQVTITLTNALKENTTYSINFREAIQDITEKNPAQMLKLAFSTGDYIDSLSIDGTIYDLLTGKELKDATIGLYTSDTFNIFKHRPTYLTKSDSKGKFKIENLKPAQYFIYGLDDKNKNLIADSRTESYGFLREPIVLAKDTSQISIPLFRLDSRPLKLTSARPFGTYFNIKTTKSLTSYALSANKEKNIVSSFGEDLSNIKVYNTFKDMDSVQIHFTARDSLSNILDTLLYVKFLERDTRPEPFEFSLQNFQLTNTKGILKGQIKFSKPIEQINFDSLYYVIDSTRIVPFSPENFSWDTLNNLLSIEKKIDRSLLIPQKEEQQKQPSTPQLTTKNKQTTTTNNQLHLGKSAFISIESDSSKRITEKITPMKLEDTGIIFVQVETKAPHFIIQLLTSDFKVIDTKRNIKKTSFEDLKPGDYQIRLIVDKNDDGKWDAGDYFLKDEPEHVVFYKNEKGVALINLKANWELGPLLIKD